MCNEDEFQKTNKMMWLYENAINCLKWLSSCINFKSCTHFLVLYLNNLNHYAAENMIYKGCELNTTLCWKIICNQLWTEVSFTKIQIQNKTTEKNAYNCLHWWKSKKIFVSKQNSMFALAGNKKKIQKIFIHIRGSICCTFSKRKK